MLGKWSFMYQEKRKKKKHKKTQKSLKREVCMCVFGFEIENCKVLLMQEYVYT